MIQMANGAHSMFSGLSPPIQYAPKDPEQSYFTFRWPPSGLVKASRRARGGRARHGEEREGKREQLRRAQRLCNRTIMLCLLAARDCPVAPPV